MTKTLSYVALVLLLLPAVGCSDSDDSPTNPGQTTLGLSINDITVTEGQEAQFTVTLFPASDSTVRWWFQTYEGTATTNVDYLSNSGGVQIPPGVTSWTIEVTTFEDTLTEGSETFTLVLFDAINASVADSVGTCTIVD